MRKIYTRLLSSDNDLLDDDGCIDTMKTLHVMLVGEKPGGGMERSVPIRTLKQPYGMQLQNQKIYHYTSYYRLNFLVIHPLIRCFVMLVVVIMMWVRPLMILKMR